MRRLVVALMLVLVWAAGAHADSPILPHDWERVVGSYRFVMLSPYESATELDYPSAGLYQADGASQPLWKVDWYAHEGEVFLAPDGQHLARLGPWAQGGVYDELAVAFYQNGTLMKSYLVRDLVANPQALPHSVSHYQWHNEVTFDPDQLHLTIATVPGITYRFDVTTGEMVKPGAAGGSLAAQATEPAAGNRAPARVSAVLGAAAGLVVIGVAGIWLLVRRRS
jgi:hypothetical protein